MTLLAFTTIIFYVGVQYFSENIILKNTKLTVQFTDDRG